MRLVLKEYEREEERKRNYEYFIKHHAYDLYLECEQKGVFEKLGIDVKKALELCEKYLRVRIKFDKNEFGNFIYCITDEIINEFIAKLVSKKEKIQIGPNSIKLIDVKVFVCNGIIRFFHNDKPIRNIIFKENDKIPFMVTPTKKVSPVERYTYRVYPTNNLFYIIAHGGDDDLTYGQDQIRKVIYKDYIGKKENQLKAESASVPIEVLLGIEDSFNSYFPQEMLDRMINKAKESDLNV